MTKPTRNQIIAGAACTLAVGSVIISTVLYNLPKSDLSPESPPAPEGGGVTTPERRPETGNDFPKDTAQTAKAEEIGKKTKKSKNHKKTTKLPQTGDENKTQKPTKSKKHQEKTTKPPKAKSRKSGSQGKKKHEEASKTNKHKKEAIKPADSQGDKEQNTAPKGENELH